MSRATLESIIGDNTIEEIIEQTHENPDWKSRGYKWLWDKVSQQLQT